MKIRTAILGYGRSGGGMHAGSLENNSDAFEVAAVCDIRPERLDLAAKRFGCKLYEDYREMLDKERLDLVSIVTRTDQHASMTCDCLAAGVSVLVTKPWAVNETEARRMVEAAREAAARHPRRLLLPWLPARWGSDLRRLKRILKDKVIGNVFMIRRAVSTFATRNDWQTERRYGGGYLLNWGPHIVDTPIVLKGSRVSSVYGRMKQTINPGDVEDVFLAVMNLADGTIVQAEFTIAVESLPSWFIQGDEGTVVVREHSLRIYRRIPNRPEDPTDRGAMTVSEEGVIEERLENELYGDPDTIYKEVGMALRGEREFPVAPADALELTRVLDAIRVSSEQNRVVML